MTGEITSMLYNDPNFEELDEFIGNIKKRVAEQIDHEWEPENRELLSKWKLRNLKFLENVRNKKQKNGIEQLINRFETINF